MACTTADTSVGAAGEIFMLSQRIRRTRLYKDLQKEHQSAKPFYCFFLCKRAMQQLPYMCELIDTGDNSTTMFAKRFSVTTAWTRVN